MRPSQPLQRRLRWGSLLDLDLQARARGCEVWQLVRACAAQASSELAGYVRCDVEAESIYCEWHSASGVTSSGLTSYRVNAPHRRKRHDLRP